LRKKEFTKEVLQQIKLDYESGKSVAEIAMVLGCSKKVIYKCLKEMGIALKGRRINFSEEFLEKIKSDYESQGKTIKEIAIENGLSSKVVTTRLKEMGVMFRKGGPKIKYTCNEHYFDVIDNQEKAYWLGFIYADGCVSRNYGNYVFQISLQANDRLHLEKFLKAINSNHPIYDGMSVIKKIGNFPNCKINFYSSPNLCKRLVELGGVERKSLTLKFPSKEIIPDALMSHFIRGFFDGDGCISAMRKGSRNTPSDTIFVITFTGTKEMLEGIKRYLPLTREIEIVPHGNVFELRIAGNKQIKQVLEYMYNGAEIFLERKKEMYMSFLEHLKQVDLYKNHIVHTQEQVKLIQLIFTKYLELNTINNVKKFLNENGYRTFRGNLFSSRGLYNVLRNESYKGEVLVDGTLKNIISPEIFDNVQKQLDKNKNDILLRTQNMVQYMIGK
jgi:AraC-like DNA-binding protein